MYSFFDIQFWLYFILFLIAIFFSIYIPGYYWIKKLPIKSLLVFHLLSIVLGFVLWGIQGYIFGYLNLRFVTYGYILLFALLVFFQRTQLLDTVKSSKKKLAKFDRVALSLIIIGMILQAYPVFMSGMMYSDGVRFFDVNATDGVLHLGYIQSMTETFPPQEPGINMPLINYHYWSDLVLAELARVWKLPTIHLFFQFIPPVISLVTGLGVYALIRVWGGSKVVGWWALFLLYFAGDAAYTFSLALHQKLSFHTPAIDNGAAQFLNLPHATAKMIFISSLIPLYYWIKQRKISFGLLSFLLFAVLVGFKVYYGIFVAIGMVLLLTFEWGKSIIVSVKNYGVFAGLLNTVKAEKQTIGIFMLYILISAVVYFPPNKSSGGLFFAPLEWPKLFLSSEGLNFEEWWLRRQVYEAAANTKALLVYDMFAIFIALVSIHGTRLLGFIPDKKLYKNLGIKMLLFLIPGSILFNLLGLYTLQESGLFNVYNFFVVSTIILSLFSAFILGRIHEKKNVFSIVFLTLFVLLTVPRIVSVVYNFTGWYTRNPINEKIVSHNEMQVLEFVRDHTDDRSIIQTHLLNHWDQESPYSVFFAQRNSFLTGTRLLETHNQPVEARKTDLEQLFDAPNSGEYAQKMKQFGIDYILLKKDKDQSLSFPIDETFLQIPFENNEFMVIKNISK